MFLRKPLVLFFAFCLCVVNVLHPAFFTCKSFSFISQIDLTIVVRFTVQEIWRLCSARFFYVGARVVSRQAILCLAFDLLCLSSVDAERWFFSFFRCSWLSALVCSCWSESLLFLLTFTVQIGCWSISTGMMCQFQLYKTNVWIWIFNSVHFIGTLISLVLLVS